MDDMSLSKHQVATFAGVGVSTVEKVLAGKTNVQMDGMIRVALCLGVAVSDIYPPLATRPRQPRLLTQAPGAVASFKRKLSSA